MVGTSLFGVVGTARADVTTCVSHYEEAQIAMRRGRLRNARGELAACLALECPTSLRSDCARWLEEVTRRMPSVVVDCLDDQGRRDVDARRSVDGVDAGTFDGRAIDLDPGPHTARCVGPHGNVDVTFSVAEGERPVVTARPLHAPSTQPAPARRPPVSAYVFAGIGVAALGAFAGFAFAGNAGKSDLEECKPGCADSVIDGVRMKYIVADVSLGVSAVALGAALYLFLRQPPAAERRAFGPNIHF